jgi:hypothetical protein
MQFWKVAANHFLLPAIVERYNNIYNANVRYEGLGRKVFDIIASPSHCRRYLSSVDGSLDVGNQLDRDSLEVILSQ